MPKIGVFYGSTYGNTANAAAKIAAHLERLLGQPILPQDIAQVDLKTLEGYDKLLLGCSTWNIGELQYDWEVLYRQLDTLDLNGKQVALFGCGDQLGYPDSFQDALGILGEKLEERGASLVGLWPVAGYEHTRSLGQRGEFFLGLALDEDNQAHLSEGRIARWVEQVLEEFGLLIKVDG